MTLQLLLYILGTIGLGLEAARLALPRVSFGWLGLTLIAFAALILPVL
jgi:hypothetical protein